MDPHKVEDILGISEEDLENVVSPAPPLKARQQDPLEPQPDTSQPSSSLSFPGAPKTPLPEVYLPMTRSRFAALSKTQCPPEAPKRGQSKKSKPIHLFETGETRKSAQVTIRGMYIL